MLRLILLSLLLYSLSFCAEPQKVEIPEFKGTEKERAEQISTYLLGFHSKRKTSVSVEPKTYCDIDMLVIYGITIPYTHKISDKAAEKKQSNTAVNTAFELFKRFATADVFIEPMNPKALALIATIKDKENLRPILDAVSKDLDESVKLLPEAEKDVKPSKDRDNTAYDMFLIQVRDLSVLSNYVAKGTWKEGKGDWVGQFELAVRDGKRWLAAREKYLTLFVKINTLSQIQNTLKKQLGEKP
jgi:hypothetical protein